MRAVAFAAMAFALASAAWAAWSQGWTYDEPIQLQWTERMLDTGVTERASNRRFNSRTPAPLPNVLARKGARYAGVTDARALRFIARLPSLAWLALIFLGVYALARPAFGAPGAWLAMTATALDPNVVAHGSLATVDAALAAAVVAALACAAAYARSPRILQAAGLGFAVGLALVIKFSALLLVGGLAVLPVYARRPIPRARDVGLHVLAAAVVAWTVVASWYLFLDIGLPLGEIDWVSGPFRSLSAAIPWLRIPAPAAFLSGVDHTLADERGGWGAVILGRHYPTGVWFYFVVLWLVKTPLLLLATQVGACAAGARRLIAHPVAILIAWTMTVHLAYFSLVFRAQSGYRFVLMLVPLGYVLAAAGIVHAGLSPRRLRILALVALVTLFENAAYLGNPLAFTNATVWPKKDAYRIVADSNIDWGQNRERLDAEIARAGAGHTVRQPLHIVLGHNTLDLNELAGVFDFERHRWVRENLRPGGHFGHTYLWYEVGSEDFDRFLSETRRLSAQPWVSSECPAETPLQRHPAGARIPLRLDVAPRPGDGFVVCVETRRGVDFGFRAVKGLIRFGRVDPTGACRADTMVAGQVSWHRLDPGRHALCIVEMPNRRAYLPYLFEGRWLARGRAVSIGLRRRSWSG